MNAFLRSEVESLLRLNGYSEVATEVKIGDITMQAEGLWEGPRESLELVLIAKRPDTRESTSRLFWLVQRVTRALDTARSRRSVTVVVVGALAPHNGVGELLELARVLVVDGSLPTERMLGPLFRLQLPATATAQLDGIAQVVANLVGTRHAPELLRLAQAASAGSSLVSDRYKAWIDEAFISNRSQHD